VIGLACSIAEASMKRDMDLCRQILLQVEETPEDWRHAPLVPFDLGKFCVA